ncbi:MAG TPA: SPOR domain-containing protein [Rhodospirillales bacterium]|nr:SPOR domain-containing protein [Rhodospirillales bacterium]
MADEDDEADVPEIPEILAFEPVERSRPGGRRGLLVALVLIPVFLGAAGWAAWHYLGDLLIVEDAYDVPLVLADPGPVKVRPENPGGMQVPDQDKLVYDRMRGDEKPPQVESLLPRSETPLPPPTATLPPVPAEKEPDKVVEKAVEKAATAPTPLTPPKAPKAAPSKASTEEVLAAKPRPAPPPPTPKVAPQPEAGANLRVQLAAVRSPEQARGEWERLRRKNGDLLGKLRLFITKTDLGPGKGIYFRLRAGPLASEAKAKALCASLAERKVGCLVVRPEG